MPTREEWLEERRTCIGASDAPTVLDINPFKSAYRLWAEKSGLIEPDDLSDNEAVEFGIRLETPVAEAFAYRTGREIRMWEAFTMLRAINRPHLGCTPDAVQYCRDRGEGLLQVKTTNQFNAKKWKKEPPLEYQIQCQTELFVSEFEWGSICVLIGGQKFAWFDFERDDAFLKLLVPRLDAFWQRVVEGRPPDVIDGSESTAQALLKMHPDDNGREVMLPAESAQWDRDIKRCKELIADLQAVIDVSENKLKAAMGDATYGVLPDLSRWSWKTSDRDGYSVAPTTCRTLRKLKSKR